MAEKLHVPSDKVEKSPRPSMTVRTTLGDGTTINLSISPSSTESSTVTASTTFTDTSFCFHIRTSLSNQSSGFRKHPDSPRVPSLINLASDKSLKPTSTHLSPGKHVKPIKMSRTLPEDVVAIDTGERSYLFYVSTDEDGLNQLTYLESPDDTGKGNYKLKKITQARDEAIKDDDENLKSIKVSAKTKQLAAITWQGSEGPEIRVYYVEKGSEHLREVCKKGNRSWTIGSLSYDLDKGEQFKIRPGTSISASVHTYPGNKISLRVFAAPLDKELKGLPLIFVHKFVVDKDDNSSNWHGSSISNGLTSY